MNVLNPLLLLGLLAAAIPIIIHLSNRRRAVTRPFPAIEFLLRSQKKLARRLKLRQYILLALRIGALLLIPLAMARPYIVTDTGQDASQRLPSDTVFVLDDSASMRYNNDAYWIRAKDTLRERVSSLKPWDRAALVLASSFPSGAPLGEDAPVPDLTDAHGEILDALETLTPSNRSTNLQRALRQAADILSTSQANSPRVVLLTDRQESGLNKDTTLPASVGTIEIADLNVDSKPFNIAVTSASTTTQAAGAQPTLSIRASIRNTSNTPATNINVSLLLEGENVATNLIDIAPNATETVTFLHRFTSQKSQRARIQLAPETDKHPADNIFDFPIHIAQRVRALLVNGDPRSVPQQDELFYLERALFPNTSSSSSITPTSTGVGGLASTKLEDFDVIVLANVETLPRTTIRDLEQFVKKGGGLLFISGKHIQASTYNTLFASLLPKPIRSTKRLAQRSDPDAPLKIVRFAQGDPQHPIFQVFDLPGGETLQSVPVYSYLLLEPTPSSEAKTILSYSDGAPALIEKPLGDGRVALLTTTVDRDWTDLPIKPPFLPLSRRLVRYLAQRSSSNIKNNHYVGHKISIDPPSKPGTRLEVIAPDDTRIVPTPESTRPNTPLTFIARARGHYRVVTLLEESNETREDTARAFAINIDPNEALLTPLPIETLRTTLTPSSPKDGTSSAASPDIPEKRLGVWSMLLFLATLILLAETILGTRRSVLQRIWNTLRPKRA